MSGSFTPLHSTLLKIHSELLIDKGAGINDNECKQFIITLLS